MPILAVNALEEELEEAAAFCRDEGVGLEVTAFAYPESLDEGFRTRLERHVTALEGISPILLHGPFLDLYPASADPRIVEVARERHERALEAAATLGAVLYVAHLNSVPLIRNREYRERFVTALAEFWSPLADRAGRSDTTIVLENMWEREPELQGRVVAEAGHPRLKASFDNGHALVFSGRPAREWIRELGGDLAHVHVHDNDGEYDQHLPVGEGCEGWPELIYAWREHASRATLVVESDSLVANRRSLAVLRELIGGPGLSAAEQGAVAP